MNLNRKKLSVIAMFAALAFVACKNEAKKEEAAPRRERP